MKHVHAPYESNRVDQTESISVVIRYDLQDACASKSVKRFRVGTLIANLREPKSETDLVLNFVGKLAEVSP